MFTILGADGKEYGPVTMAHVREWIRDGRANLETKARRAGETGWQTLGSFPEFNERAASSTFVPPRLATNPTTPGLQPDRLSKVEPSLWLRLPAAMIDGFLKVLCYLPITIPLVRAIFAEALRGEQRSFTELSELTNGIVNENIPHALPFFALLVVVQLILLTWRGQSVGKLVFGLRIVRVPDDAPPGFARAFLLRGTLPFLLEQIPVLGVLFWITDSCFIFREDRRCLHDLVAGTRVIRP